MRTDAHAPSNFDPADYRVIDYIDNKRPEPPMPPILPGMWEAYERYLKIWQERIFQYFPEWRTGGDDHQSIHQCNHCGHPGIRWVAVVEHIPTGKYLAFGETCADRVELPGRDAFRAKHIKDRAALEQAAYENEQRRSAFREANPEVVAYLLEVNLDYDSEYSEFEQSLARQLRNKGELSEAQVNALQKSIERQKQFEERKAAEREALKDAPPLPEGRRQIEGEVLSVKVQDGYYGLQVKMLIREADGNKVWGTVPEVLETIRVNDSEGNYAGTRMIEKGERVRLTATVERSQDDEHFGFYKRPTKPELITEVAA